MRCETSLRLTIVVRSWLVERTEARGLLELLYESEAVKILWRQRGDLYLRDDVAHRRTPGDVEQLLENGWPLRDTP